jgi:predicted metalloprotease
MRWRGRRRSSNVEDARGSAARTPLRLGKRGGRIGGIGLVAIVAFVLLGGDPAIVVNLLSGSAENSSSQLNQPSPAADDPAAEFVSVVLADTEETWTALFLESGQTYREPKLRLFTGSVQSACGYNTSATGPFYCPPDERVYLDVSFFGELSRLGAPGDFAQAYVIGHEIAHHVQNLMGVFQSLRSLQQNASKAQANALQVLAELQADCYAGVWAHYADRDRGLLEPGDLEEGLQAAASIGDDRLQRNAGRQVQPESFTHGSSAQRTHWFKAGLQTGRADQCDTFEDAGIRL